MPSPRDILIDKLKSIIRYRASYMRIPFDDVDIVSEILEMVIH